MEKSLDYYQLTLGIFYHYSEPQFPYIQIGHNII